jgi:predicted transcriptional regulator
MIAKSLDKHEADSYLKASAMEDAMTAKRTMTLNLTDAEMRALDDLSVRKDLTKTAVLRQALRLYQTIEARLDRGDKLLFENDATKEKAELMLV